MPIVPPLRKRLLAAAGSGAFAIALMLLGGHDGLEGRRYTPYLDVAGVLTVCDGHTGPDIEEGKIYSDSECDRFLHADLSVIQAGVDKLVRVPLSEYQRAAVYSFAYNVGIEALTRSTLLKKLNAGDIKGACYEMRRWVYANGVKRKGLINRRQIEQWIFETEEKDVFLQKPFLLNFH